MSFTALAVAGGIKAVGRLRGGRKQRKADRKAIAEQERLDAENRALYRREVDESVRRTEEMNLYTEGVGRTQVAGSGFAAGSSLDRYLATVQETHSSDVDWMRTSGASQEKIMERESSARARASRAQSKINYQSTLWSAAGDYGTTLVGGMKW